MAGQPAIAVLLDGLVNEWLLRALLLLSFTAQLLLVLLAGIRRHSASGGRRILLWLVYQLANWSAQSALGKLFLGSTSRQEQLLAFWTPFLLMHLARPDNISAYTLEDSVLAGRQLLVVPLQVLGTSYVLYKHIIIVENAGTLLPASCIMFSLGIVKYVEGVFALSLGNLGNIRSSIKKLKKTGTSIKYDSGKWEDLDDEGALLVAHRVFYISKGAFADYSFGSSKVFSHEWKDMRKVVEMELSLMYDIMYTKAAVIHTWLGYSIRILSPPFTAVTLLLFFFHNTDGQRGADVAITYILLIGTFLLDVGWLLRAVWSTWTYAFLKDNYWLHSALLERRWRGLRRFAVSLGLSKDPSSYRMWSGNIGQYNILHETTHTTSLCSASAILKWIGMEASGMEYQHSRGLKISPFVKDLLFEWIWKRLNSVVVGKKMEEEKKKKEAKEEWPPRDKSELVADQEAGFGWRRALDEALKFRPEFQEIVLTWHIATNIFLLFGLEKAGMYTFEYVKAIEELSNYMMFLVVVRPNMIPGLKLSSLHDATRKDLKEIWEKPGNPSSTLRERELASRLRGNKYYKSLLLSDGTLYAELLLARLGRTNWNKLFRNLSVGDKSKKFFLDLLQLSSDSDSDSDILSEDSEFDMQKMLELILDSWVRLLIHASVRCSRDSHAKQLSRGGELTTVVWILVEHAGIYSIPV